MRPGKGWRVSRNQMFRLSRSLSWKTLGSGSAQGSLQKNITLPGGHGKFPEPLSELQSGLRVVSVHTLHARGSRPVQATSRAQRSKAVSNWKGVPLDEPARPKRRTTPESVPHGPASARATSAALKAAVARRSHVPPLAQLFPTPHSQVQLDPSGQSQLPRRKTWSGI